MHLEALQAVVGKYDLDAALPTPAHLAEFFSDIDEGDRFEFSRTARNDWQAELRATFENATEIFLVSSRVHGGRAVFGTTRIANGLAQIWLLQSKTFAREAARHHGRGWPIRAARLTNATVALAQRTYRTVFNFIPKTQTRNIRLLKHSDFTFYEHPSQPGDMYFFAAGIHGTRLSRDPRFWTAFLGE